MPLPRTIGSGRALLNSAAGESPLLTNLVSYWSLEEASGTRSDAYGTNHLTDNNTVTSTTGKIGNAAEFVAANSESLSVASNATLQMGDNPYTLWGWVYANSITGTKNLITKDVGGTATEFLLRINTSNLQFIVGNGTSQYTAQEASLIATTWYFFVAWHDPAADTVNLQVNGGVVRSTSTTGTAPGATSNTFILGNRSGAAVYHDGLMDEIGLRKGSLLSAAERTWLYGGGNGRSFADIQAYRG